MDELFTVPEVAKMLKTNVEYVHKLRRSGILPFMKLGSYKCTSTTLMRFLNDYEGKDVNSLI